MPALDTLDPPNCPTCAKPVFRRGRMVKFMENLENRRFGEQSYTVCMHCSAIWKLRHDADGITLLPLPDDERDDMWPALKAAVMKFDLNRRVAAQYGLTITEFMDRIDALPPHIRRQLMD